MSQLEEAVKYAKIVQFIKDYNIENATINDDLTVDVMGSVKLSNNDLTKIPVQFGKVTGDFFCSNNYLTTLKGLPRHVFGCVFCGDNKLTSLEGAPEVVGCSFICIRNPLLKNLKGIGHVDGVIYSDFFEGRLKDYMGEI